MFCHKCGTEILSDESMFCYNCREPILKGASAPGTLKSSSEGQSPPSEACPSTINLEFGDNDEALKKTDPIDFLMEQNAVPESAGDNPAGSSPTDKIKINKDKDLDALFRADVTGSALDIDALKGGPGGQSIGTLTEKTVKKEAPSLLQIPGGENQHEGENIIATTKIELKEAQNDELQESNSLSATAKIRNAKAIVDSLNLDIAKIKHSSGVVYISGNNLTFPVGPKITPGDQIQIGENAYEVRLKPKDKKSLYGLIGSVIIAVFTTLYFLGAFGRSPYGNLVGMVVGPDDRPLAGQKIGIRESGDKFATNSAGFFIFDNLKSGIYTVEYYVDDEVVAEERITVLGGKTSTLTLSESRAASTSGAESNNISNRQSRTEEKKTELASGTGTAAEQEPGFLKLTLNPDNARAYLDGKPLGVGSNTYRVRPGSYLLSVKKNGFQDQSKKITVKSGKDLSYTFSLKKEAETRKASDSETAREYETAGKYSDALGCYDKILARNSSDLPALLGKARCLKALGREEDALGCFTRAAKIGSELGNTDAQYKALTGIIEMKPNNLATYEARGDLLFSLNDFSRAADDYQKVITLDSRNLKTYYKLGSCYYNAARFTDALETFKAAEQLHFADPKAHAFLAKTYRALDDKKNTKKSYEKFKELASYSTALEFKKDPEWKKVLDYLGVEN